MRILFFISIIILLQGCVSGQQNTLQIGGACVTTDKITEMKENEET